MSSLCAAARSSTRGVDLAQVGHGIRDLVALGVLEVHAQLVGGLEVAHVVGGGDERLAGHAVGEHRGAPQPVALDHGDLGAEVGGDEGGLVPTGAPTEDDDSARPCAHVAIQPLRARSARPAPTTRAHTIARRGKWPVNGAGSRGHVRVASRRTHFGSVPNHHRCP